jgi:DNA-directed RNA polymerase I, II, and III subunit RPABC3
VRAVSRLYSHSKNYDMDMQLDYNVELFPLRAGQEVAMALATSLARGPVVAGEEDDKDKDVWRPDGKGRRGLEEDYDYVMYGKVRCPLPAIHCTPHFPPLLTSFPPGLQVRRRQRRDSVRALSRAQSAHADLDPRTVYASFGGLLMAMTGSYRHMSSIVLGEPVYILLRK